jgi:hypothetical protein
VKLKIATSWFLMDVYPPKNCIKWVSIHPPDQVAPWAAEAAFWQHQKNNIPGLTFLDMGVSINGGTPIAGGFISWKIL